MLQNYETVVVGRRCVLVPYRPEHVGTYHGWMQDPELLQATASEPLAIQQEFEMQSSWRDDPDKCTFIVLAREACSFLSAPSGGGGGGCNQRSTADSTNNSLSVPSSLSSYPRDDDFVRRNIHAMAGDVNLFLSSEEREGSDEEEADDPDSRKGDSSLQAEIDIMIAESKYRNHGLGREACTLMLRYGIQHFGIRRFFCKIGESNEASLRLFKALGFTQCGYAACFRELELELRCKPNQQVLQLSRTSDGEAIESDLRTFSSRLPSASADDAAKDASSREVSERPKATYS